MANINEFSFILTHPCGCQLFGPFCLNHIVMSRGRNQNEQLCCFLSCSQDEKKGKTQVEKKAAKTESSGDRKQRRAKKRQRILISDYIDRIISQLYPLFFSVPFFLVSGFSSIRCYLAHNFDSRVARDAY